MERGLKSVAVLREERKASKFGKPTTGFFGLVGVGLLVTLGVAYFASNRELEAARGDLLKKQRAAGETVGKEWAPLRDSLEAVALAEAKSPSFDDLVKPEVATWDFRALPGIYLRVRQAEATTVEALRAAAATSQRDGFCACLMKGQAAPEGDAGVADERPWNLHRAYAATRVLEPSWVDEVKSAENDTRLRVFAQQYEKAQVGALPVAIEIVKRAQFFMLVLDEDTDEAKAEADGGVPTSEQLQAMGHPARVVVVNLKTKDVVVRLRRTAGGQFFMAGEHHAADAETMAAMRRQVNNCALAQAVTAELTKVAAPK
ncbi:MAG: hypothetical protein IPK71_24815 [Myxococcales bacterium]|nr:hypothetical protein [Myxococcales bacterium]